MNKPADSRLKVNFITFCNPTNAYAGVQYICDDLAQSGFDVELFCRIPASQMASTTRWNFRVNNIAGKWYGNARVIRTVGYWIEMLILFARGERNFIFHEAHFFRLIVLFKWLSSRTRCVHYATELYTANDEPAHKGILEYYRRTASVPDLVVECEENRAVYRRTEYGIKTRMCVIPNTLPVESDSYVQAVPAFVEEMRTRNAAALPVLVYSGAGYLHRELDRIVDGVALSGIKVFMLLICYGPEAELAKVRQYAAGVLGEDGFLFVQNATREEIKRALEFADVGIVYYRPSLSIGNRFAAPTKFFEYLAAGLPVVCSHNKGLQVLVDRLDLGSVTEDESPLAIGLAIERVLRSPEPGAVRRERIRRQFRDHLCFDVSAREGMKAIRSVFVGDSR